MISFNWRTINKKLLVAVLLFICSSTVAQAMRSYLDHPSLNQPTVYFVRFEPGEGQDKFSCVKYLQCFLRCKDKAELKTEVIEPLKIEYPFLITNEIHQILNNYFYGDIIRLFFPKDIQNNLTIIDDITDFKQLSKPAELTFDFLRGKKISAQDNLVAIKNKRGLSAWSTPLINKLGAYLVNHNYENLQEKINHFQQGQPQYFVVHFGYLWLPFKFVINDEDTEIWVAAPRLSKEVKNIVSKQSENFRFSAT